MAEVRLRDVKFQWNFIEVGFTTIAAQTLRVVGAMVSHEMKALHCARIISMLGYEKP